jgi:hypothetical protein
MFCLESLLLIQDAMGKSFSLFQTHLIYAAGKVRPESINSLNIYLTPDTIAGNFNETYGLIPENFLNNDTNNNKPCHRFTAEIA